MHMSEWIKHIFHRQDKIKSQPPVAAFSTLYDYDEDLVDQLNDWHEWEELGGEGG